MGKSSKKGRQSDDSESGNSIALNERVRVHAGMDDEACGVVVEDFGNMAGFSVELGETHFADAARRWAVLLDDGSLVFVDDHQIAPE